MKNYIYYMIVLWLLGRVLQRLVDEAEDSGYERGSRVEHMIHTAPDKDEQV